MVSKLSLFTLFYFVYSECPPGSLNGFTSDRCYKIFGTPSSFMDAEDACVLLGGHLTSISNGFENSFLANMAKSIFINVENVWVGGNRVTVPGNWTWTDGKPFVYTNWAKGEPSTTQGSDYLAVGASTGTWSAQPNSLNLPYICEVLPSPESTSTCPTISSPSCTSQPCVCSTPSVTDYCPSGWKYFNYTRECYYLGTAEDWGTARLYCVQIGGQLASIHNHEENTFIADLTNGNTNPIWTGLNKYSGDWSWIDGTPYDYQNWDCHSCPDGCEPHSTWQCGCMIGICGNPDTDQWANDDCRITRNFVCKRPSNNN